MCDMNTNDDSECAIDLSLTRPAVLQFPLTSLSPTKTSEKKNVPAAGPSNNGDKNQDVDADASETKVILLPKKRPYVVSQTQTEEKQITCNIDIVTKQNQSTDKKSQELEFATSDKLTVKPAHKAGKKQSQKASASQPSTSRASTSQPSTSQASTSQPSTLQPSTSKTSTSQASKSKASTSKASKSQASTSKGSKSQESTSKATSKASSTPNIFEVRKEANSNLPSSTKPSASTSVASSSSSTDSHFWLEVLNSKFRCSGYKNLLRESTFTEAQAELLQNLFYQTSQNMYNTYMNSDRITKTHNCRDCEFAIRHQCVSVNFLHAGWANGNPMTPTVVAPHTTTICTCQFAFFHAHTSRPSRSETVNTRSLKGIIASLRCDVCDTMVMFEHPHVENTKCTLTKWSGINSSDEIAFHAELVDYIKDFTPQTLSLEELYTCNHHCCLFFHRCTE